MKVDGLTLEILIFLVADIVFHIFVYRYIMRVDVLMSAVKDEYLNIIKKEIAQVNTCFEKWQESVDYLGEMLAVLKEVVGYDQG